MKQGHLGIVTTNLRQKNAMLWGRCNSSRLILWESHQKGTCMVVESAFLMFQSHMVPSGNLSLRKINIFKRCIYKSSINGPWLRKPLPEGSYTTLTPAGPLYPKFGKVTDEAPATAASWYSWQIRHVIDFCWLNPAKSEGPMLNMVKKTSVCCWNHQFVLAEITCVWWILMVNPVKSPVFLSEIIPFAAALAPWPSAAALPSAGHIALPRWRRLPAPPPPVLSYKPSSPEKSWESYGKTNQKW